ncbi:MAG: Methionine aminopeptidase [Candidatus Moranbacteria bacterium GW2011_GWC2_37_73]|nr:MAG: Methionine aminopeptidase [Parcubacteria group bacterium GW2011_GWC1_36_108]KKQ00466.1 MAG: Methionine aminopeptidase [Candidatus Moranbacteria bacterium GW2011_GWD1_36_198]KKQ01698.1 MAG: Methionine aminopeptidase [Candidatus Moranbacteria bacterium GW2011_GWD2_36_198]KKQ39617.1 MAG: Methionine aminopeptidase [Candidatus Moranbacteria bacterium GW2011_GWC2_37_73]HAR99951.1 type I methionyl aminopeptidase [Candidatus Moranbacteria bacterium]
MSISIKTESEIAIMRRAGKMLAEIMREIGEQVRPGVSTIEIDKLAEELVLNAGGTPAFKGYGGGSNPFPATICASINDEIVHGIPSEDKILKNGDIFKIDIGIEIEGFYSDMARTFAVGEISAEAQKLMEITEKAFWKGIKNLKAGSMLSEYCKTAQKIAEDAGFSVVKNLVGHGIGKNLHEDPQVPNYFEKGFRDLVLEQGMTLALEPMVNVGTHLTVMSPDGWAYLTADRKLSAHYENTILITKNGVEVLTV